MYPGPMLTTVSVAEVGSSMEGSSRPTHFAGVATVVAKLFAIVGECSAYFGDKDFQQLAVVRRMASDLSFPVRVVGCPIVREADGVAMSSRNVYLTPEQRAAAPVLRRALDAGIVAIREGERSAEQVRVVMWAQLASEPAARPDYAEVADPATLQRVEVATPDARLFVAAQLGNARLIDNAAASDAPWAETAGDASQRVAGAPGIGAPDATSDPERTP
jgi:pantoate--beta-alanine ligase